MVLEKDGEENLVPSSVKWSSII